MARYVRKAMGHWLILANVSRVIVGSIPWRWICILHVEMPVRLSHLQGDSIHVLTD